MMQDASAQAKRTLAVLSPDYLESRFSREEWTAALAQETLLPVRVRDVELDGILAVQIYVDLVGLTEAETAQRLVEELGRKGRLKPSGKPHFPGSQPRFPGALPEVWNVPPIRNPNFTGRDEELVSLETALRAHHVVALTGLGGVGKSQLAVQLAHRCAQQLDIVWWISAEEPATLVRDLAALAGRLGVGQDDDPAAAEAARRLLEQRGGWLLVFDNVENPASVRPFLPQTGSARVVITSRRAAWSALAYVRSVEPLPPGEAEELLRRRSGKDDPQATAPLAARLGGLPLALEQAAAYVEATGMPLAEYLLLLEERSTELLKRTPDADAPTVATVWELSFQKLRATAPNAAALLNLAAFLAPDDIPRGLFDAAEMLPEPLVPLADPLAYADALAALAGYSLITHALDGFSLHRLVQDVTRDRLSSEERDYWAATGVALMRAVFPYDLLDHGTWEPTARLLPHALRACEHAESAGVATSDTGQLLNEMASYLARRARYAESREFAERAVRLISDAHGPEHPWVAVALINLSSALRHLDELEPSLEACQEALRIDEAAFGSDHPEVATDLSVLGQILGQRGDLEGATNATERALAIDEKHLDEHHPAIGIRLNNLATFLARRGDLDGALAAHRRGLEIDLAGYPAGHPNTGIRMANIGSVFALQGEYLHARESLEEALAIFEAALGVDHPYAVSARQSLAQLPGE